MPNSAYAASVFHRHHATRDAACGFVMRHIELRVLRQPSVDILRGRPLVGRSRYRQSERRKFAQPFPQNEDLVVEHQDLRRPARTRSLGRAGRRRIRNRLGGREKKTRPLRQPIADCIAGHRFRNVGSPAWSVVTDVRCARTKGSRVLDIRPPAALPEA